MSDSDSDMIEVRLSDSMAADCMIDRSHEIGEPAYRIASVRRDRRRSAIYTATRRTWLVWLRHCLGNAGGALDDPGQRRSNRQAADRIAAAIGEPCR